MVFGMLSLVAGNAWLWRRHELLLHYFYAAELAAITHLLTLGFITSVCMGIIQRLLPLAVKISMRSRRLAQVQFGLFLAGVAGIVIHFWIHEWSGMAGGTLLVLAAAVVQLVNLADVFPAARQGHPVARHVAAALVFLVAAALLGVLLGLNKAALFDVHLLPAPLLPTLFAHMHLAAVGWVSNLIFGFQLKLVPATAGGRRWLALRFWLLQAGIVGLAATLLMQAPGRLLFAGLIAVAVAWHVWGPTRHFLTGRVREWSIVPLWLLVGVVGAGLTLAAGVLPDDGVLTSRLQVAYGYVGLVGWIVLTVVAMAFKLFPMWVWQERFQRDYGRRPVPGVTKLYSRRLRGISQTLLTVGVVGTASAILAGSAQALQIFPGLVLLGIVAFLANFVRMARWALLNLEYHPTPADWEDFRRMFPDAPGAAEP